MALPRVFLIFNKTDWSTFTRQDEVRALAAVGRQKGFTVIAVNRPLCPLSTVFRKPSRLKEYFGTAQLEPLAENLFLASPKYWLSDVVAWRYPWVERRNLQALRRWYESVRSQLGLSSDPPLVWYYHPVQGYVSELFPGAPTVYEMYDYLAAADDKPDGVGQRLEVANRQRVDGLLCVTPSLLRRYAPFYRNAWLSGNGLSQSALSRFADDHIAVDPRVAAIAQPRLGYAGVISERLDWSLLRVLVERNPAWQFVFVGRQTGRLLERRLGSAPNVHYLGEVERNRVPEIVAGFDVGLLPYLASEFIFHSNPLKFYEAAAAGVPSVSSPNDLLASYPDELVRTVACAPEAWEAAIQAALSLRSADLRRRYAAVLVEHTWEKIAERVVDQLDAALRQPGVRQPECGPPLFD